MKNSGSQKYDMMGTVNIIPIYAHYNPDSLTNIILFEDVSYIPAEQVTMDT